jgi:hypothetical protein
VCVCGWAWVCVWMYGCIYVGVVSDKHFQVIIFTPAKNFLLSKNASPWRRFVTGSDKRHAFGPFARILPDLLE